MKRDHFLLLFARFFRRLDQLQFPALGLQRGSGDRLQQVFEVGVRQFRAFGRDGVESGEVVVGGEFLAGILRTIEIVEVGFVDGVSLVGYEECGRSLEGNVLLALGKPTRKSRVRLRLAHVVHEDNRVSAPEEEGQRAG